MISNSRQKWTVGNKVKVGFMQLTVRAVVETPGDYAPDAYILSNLNGTQLYSFVLHNGITKITPDEASDMLHAQRSLDMHRLDLERAEAASRAAVSAVCIRRQRSLRR